MNIEKSSGASGSLSCGQCHFVFAAIIFISFFSSNTSEWISHSENTIPREDTMSAIGSYNDTIYLLGGFNKKRQLTKYDIKTDSFVFYKSGFIPIGNKIFGEAQYWTQIGYDLYIINDVNTQNNKISVYNMADNSFISDFDSIPVTISDGMGRSCITSSAIHNKIFINGGITTTGIPMTETQILNIQTMEWGLASQMQLARRSHSCIIHPHNQILYSIGGASTNSWTSTIEKVSILNIYDNKWIYSNASLSHPSKGLRSFISGHHIVIIGGFEESRFTTLSDTIHIIDTNTDIMTVSDIKLVFKTAYSATIMVRDIMYAFGGGFGLDDWQSQTISSSTTTTPTQVLTSVPTYASSPSIHVSIPPDPATTFVDFDRFSTTEWDENGKNSRATKVAGIFLAVALFICLLVVVYILIIVFGEMIFRKSHGAKEPGNIENINFAKTHIESYDGYKL